ncbi:peptidylprolyl isomerase [Nitrogeniibacter mangrovi]|uniref:Peptidyl-prolyl cis-trans isomerase n=1 Tax=Nitrogeniibacter mangrovi TaxID=2016596 RepID=A0A6C1B5D3_9RHOO|nr:FKBP-type peptidyl-prolyl cis-trans isomerase [Nitrogeniibacter mangrovi]QID18677.1 peptidylprolyl isomerase [Nitrogeniibacter mangrovi]
MTKIVEPNSLVTLNYRITAESGQPLISTFEGQPATLQLGADEMLPVLEQCFVGLEEGSNHQFKLTPEQAFGPHREDLIEVVARRHMPNEDIEPMSVMEFTAPDGSRYSGLVREIDAEKAVIDFNHPLAGKTIHLEVEIIGIL